MRSHAIAITHSRGWTIYASRAATLLLTIFLTLNSPGSQESPQPQAREEANCGGLFVIQGRIVRMEGNLVTVKTPDGNPAGNAMYVVDGPKFKVDISKARILLPDGKKADTQPLAAHEHVLILLSGPYAPSPGSGGPDRIYSASIVEHLASSDVIIIH